MLYWMQDQGISAAAGDDLGEIRIQYKRVGPEGVICHNGQTTQPSNLLSAG
jgi:hypothetical protein